MDLEAPVRIKETVPIYYKYALTFEEAAEYFNIGVNRLRMLTSEPNCDFVFGLIHSIHSSPHSVTVCTWKGKGKSPLQVKYINQSYNPNFLTSFIIVICPSISSVKSN